MYIKKCPHCETELAKQFTKEELEFVIKGLHKDTIDYLEFIGYNEETVYTRDNGNDYCLITNIFFDKRDGFYYEYSTGIDLSFGIDDAVLDISDKRKENCDYLERYDGWIE